MSTSDSGSQRRRLAAACGRYCAACPAYVEGRCQGCAHQLGRTPAGKCAVFACCVVEKQLEHCGLCSDFACQLFLAHAAPLSVAKHYRALCRRTEIGTAGWLDEQESQGLRQR